MLNKTVMLCFEMTKLNQVTSVYKIEQRGESEKIGKKKKTVKEILQISDDGICGIVERKLVMAPKWEEKRAKGMRGEQKSL